jgi:hypothetical protein
MKNIPMHFGRTAMNDNLMPIDFGTAQAESVQTAINGNGFREMKCDDGPSMRERGDKNAKSLCTVNLICESSDPKSLQVLT